MNTKTQDRIKTSLDVNTPLGYIKSIKLLILRGKLEEAKVQTNLYLSSDSFSMTERNDLLRYLAIVHIKKNEFNGSKEDLQKAKNLINETLNNLKSSASEFEKLDLYLEFAKIHQLNSDTKLAKQLYNKILKTSRSLDARMVEIKAILGLGNIALEIQEHEKSLEYGLMVMRLLETTHNNVLLINAYNLIGSSYLKKRLQDKAKQFFKRALALAQKHKYAEAIVSSQKNLGVLFAMNSEYKDAMEFFLEALEAAKSINHRAHTAHCIINVGTIHAHLLNYKEALNHYSTAIAIYQDVLNVRNHVILLNNIGNTYYATAEFDTALTYFTKVLGLAESIDYHQMVAHAYAQLSKAYIAKEQFSSAIAYAKKASLAFENIDDSKEKRINLMNLAQISFYQRNYKDAIDWANQCMEKATLYKDNYYLIKCSKLLADIHEAKKDYRIAAKYYKMYATFQEDWFKDQKVKHTIDAEIRYSIKEKEKAIEILKKENNYNTLLVEQNKQMELQNEKLRHINEELKQFAYVVSHDLKEPMRMIVSYTQLIEKLYLKEFDKDAEQFFGYVKDGANRMNTLLKDLLEYATIGRKEEKVVFNDLNEIMVEVVENLYFKIEESKAEIKYSDLPTIKAERSLLVQLFQNLMSNAIKFRSDKTPRLVIKAEEDNEHILFTVSDNGIGIAKEFQDRIFKMFQRLHNRNDYEGSGIGLSICQKIVHRLGGRIWIHSEEGKGTTFYFTALKNNDIL